MATYWVKSGTGGTDAGTSWSNAAESIPGLMTAQAIAGGDTIYVHVTHSYNAGAGITWTLPETGTGLVKVICVDGGDATGASLVDGTVGSITHGATETTGGNFAFTIQTSTSQSALYVHGMNITAGAGASSISADISIGQAGVGRLTFSACTIWTNSTNAGALITLGSSTVTETLEFRNCVFQFGTAGQYISTLAGNYRFFNCSTAGTAPTTLFNGGSTSGGRAVALNAFACDFTGPTNVVNVANTISSGLWRFSNCAINTPSTGTYVGANGTELLFEACAAVDGTNGANILAYYYEDQFGNVQDSQTVYKATGGSQGEQDDGTDTSYSFKLTPSAACWLGGVLWSPWVYTLVGSTGDKTVTMKIGHTESAVLTTADLIGQIEYMGEPGLTGTQRVANSPHSQLEYDDSAPLCSGTLALDVTSTGSNRTDDGIDDWTGITSEKEHTITWSVNCAEVGYIRCRVGVAKQTTNPVYVDGKITVA